MSLVLGIETSCDECSASVVEYSPDEIRVLSLSTYSQIQLHEPYGGVIPEIASRNHLETINAMIDQALKESKIKAASLDAIAVTNRPGLVGALLVGVSAAKSMAYALNKPLVPVHHLEGHVASVFLSSDNRNKIPYPMLVAVISGGHTNLHVMKAPPELWPLDFLKQSIIGSSRDDAAGEAFDKTARLLGFPYPGGKYIDDAAKKGNPRAFDFPRALPQKSTLDYSFSGVKTAVSLEIEKLKKEKKFDASIPDLCASIQEAIIDAILAKIKIGIRENRCETLSIVGGVAANSRLRERLNAEWESYGLKAPPLFPNLKYCTDNAAMIAAAGAFRFRQGHFLRDEKLLTLNAIAYPEH